jgi:hypothetical protein
MKVSEKSLELNPATQLFAFQFKAPHGSKDGTPYRYTLVREQHDMLFDLSHFRASSSLGGRNFIQSSFLTGGPVPISPVQDD